MILGLLDLERSPSSAPTLRAIALCRIPDLGAITAINNHDDEHNHTILDPELLHHVFNLLSRSGKRQYIYIYIYIYIIIGTETEMEHIER
jgi:hypothetical protein